MAFIIDTRRMVVVYRHPHKEVLRSLVNIEFVHTSTAIVDEYDISSFGYFPIEALRKLFMGLTGGTDPHSYDHSYVSGQVARLVQTCKEVVVNEFDLRVQSMQILFHDKESYLYAPGQHRAKELEEPYVHPPLLGNWQAAQAIPLTPANNPAKTPLTPAKPAPVVAPPWQPATPAKVLSTPANNPGHIPPPWA